MTLLRKENDSLNSLIGKSFNQKNKFEADKILNEIHAKAENRTIGKKALCYIVDKNEIKGVGGSTLMKDKDGKIVSNLILDQFGKCLAGLFRGSQAGDGAQPTNVKDAGAGLNTMKMYFTSGIVFNLVSTVPLGELGTIIQVGKGTTPPTRTDFDIESDFTTPPEQNLFIPADPVYNSGLGNFKNAGSIVAGGSGTINESILGVIWKNSANGVKTFILYRDIISPAQAFIAGQNIFLEYTTQL